MPAKNEQEPGNAASESRAPEDELIQGDEGEGSQNQQEQMQVEENEEELEIPP